MNLMEPNEIEHAREVRVARQTEPATPTEITSRPRKRSSAHDRGHPAFSRSAR